MQDVFALLLGVTDFEAADDLVALLHFQHALVANLATGLAVEGALVEQDNGISLADQVVDGLAVLIDGGDLGGMMQVVVTDKVGAVGVLDAEFFHGIELAGGTRLVALHFHGGVEAVHVQCQVIFTGNVCSQIDREAVGVVETEHGLAGQYLAVELGNGLFEDLHAVFQGAGELLLFFFQHALDTSLVFGQVGIGIAHFLDQGGDQFVEEQVADAELVTVAHGAANDAAQHVTAAFVRRRDAVEYQEGTGTDVVSDNAQGRIGGVLDASDFAGGVEQVLEQVDFVVAVHVLQHGGQAL